MKKIILILLSAFIIFPAIASAQLMIPGGGTGLTTVPNQYILLGSTSPARLQAVSTSTFASFLDSLWARSTTTPSSIYNLNTGNVGVGITTPAVKLHLSVDGISPSSTLYPTSDAFVASNNGNTAMRVITAENTSAASTPGMTFMRSRGTLDAPAIVQQDDVLGTIFAQGFSGVTRTTAASIRFISDGIASSSSMPGRIVFATTPNLSGGTTDRMVIKESGNVGIGTTTPRSVLSVVGTTTSAGLPFQVTNSAGTNALSVTDAGLVSANTGFIGAFGTAAAPAYRFQSVNGGLYSLGTNVIGLSTNNTNRMTWDASGNVGIGTTTPTGKLSVELAAGTTMFSLERPGVNTFTWDMAGGTNNLTSAGTYKYSDILTDNTSKSVRIGSASFTNAQAPVGMLYANNTSIASALSIGGGTSAFNAATSIDLFTGVSTTTLTGTSRMSITAAGNIGISSTSPSARLTVQGLAAVPTATLFTVASSTNGNLFTVDSAGHIITGGPIPSISSCGTGATLSATSNDTSGTITTGTGVVTSCTLTFSTARSRIPNYVGATTGGVSVATGYSAKSTTAVTFTFSGTIAGSAINYLIVD